VNQADQQSVRPTNPIEAYRIGPKVRRLRLARSMGLVELGRHTGLSAAMLSKVETGRNIPTLLTLQRIATVFSVGLDHFFQPPEQGPACHVVRRNERLRFPDRVNATVPNYRFESLDFPALDSPFHGYFAEFEEVQTADVLRHAHEGLELLYVVSGSLVLHFGDEERLLEEGDSVCFDAKVEHGYRRRGRKRCTAVVVSGA
jgi:transcriptional regulator with XRE-family HTH domain